MAISLATGGFCFAFLLALTLNWFVLRPWQNMDAAIINIK